jgi:hypothetical protein
MAVQISKNGLIIFLQMIKDNTHSANSICPIWLATSSLESCVYMMNTDSTKLLRKIRPEYEISLGSAI